MRNYSSNRKIADGMDAGSCGSDTRTSEANVTYLPNSSAGLGQQRNSSGSTWMRNVAEWHGRTSRRY
jgi:hypothetical protein